MRLRENVNRVQLAIDLPNELERVQALAQLRERGEQRSDAASSAFLATRRPIGVRGGSYGRRSFAQVRLISIQIIHGFHNDRRVVVISAHQPTNGRPVLLLDISVIVLLVRSGGG
jgi:hypothetical protein